MVLDPPGQPVAGRGDTVAVIVTGIMTVTSDSGPPADRAARRDGSRCATITQRRRGLGLAGGRRRGRGVIRSRGRRSWRSSSEPARSPCVPWRAGPRRIATNDPSPLATGSIPAGLLVLFQQAAAASPCGVPWTLLAAVAKTESSFDANAVSSAGAQGMFQFEPATFAEYAKPTPPGGAVPPSAFDPTDAAYAAARYLCSLGVADNPTLALVAYNCGNPGPACQAASAGYAEQVLATAASYTAPGAGVPSGVQAAAVAYAESQIGTPYVYGGATPQSGFDCSGLVVWAYGLAGVVVPRVANDQWHDEPHVALDDLVPGDLVFFGSA